MKKSILSILAAAALLFASCSNDSDNSTATTTEYTSGSNLTGHITDDITLDASVEYDLSAELIVDEGASLTIPAGTVIKASGQTSSYIAVSRGAQIFIEGEENNPVVMTSAEETPANGDWGGLVICGAAPTNLGDDATSEVANLQYGGTESTDSSGSIEYLRIEYTGATFNASKEFNGVSFFGVGSGTTVTNILAYEAGDDGLEFFGGTVNASNLAVINAYDDSIDAADGFSGTLDTVYIEGVTKAAFEVSNNGDNEAKTPETNAKIKNATIVKGTDFGASENVINYKEGGGTQNYENLVFSGFDTFAKYSTDAVTSENLVEGKLTVTSYYSPDTFTDVQGILNGLTNDDTLVGAGSGTSEPTWVAELKAAE